MFCTFSEMFIGKKNKDKESQDKKDAAKDAKEKQEAAEGQSLLQGEEEEPIAEGKPIKSQ